MQRFIINGKEERILGILKRFGLNEYEGKTYFTLLLLGKSKALSVTRKSGVPSPKVYHSLYSLADRNLVNVVEGTPKEYEANGIEHLAKNFMREKKWEIVRAVKDGEDLRNMVERLGKAVDLFESVRTPVRIFTPRYRHQGRFDEDGL